MEFFKLLNKAGFLSNDKIVNIFDVNKNLFYYFENKNGLLHFNLPSGQYYTSNDLLMTVLRPYKLKEIPKPNNPKELPINGFKQYFCENPNKCTIDNSSHEIWFDNQFKDCPLFVLDYIKFHELGHYDYSGQGEKSEIYADGFSYNRMIETGYNPSQIQLAIEYALGKNKLAKRRKKIFLQTNKNQYK